MRAMSSGGRGFVRGRARDVSVVTFSWFRAPTPDACHAIYDDRFVHADGLVVDDHARTGGGGLRGVAGAAGGPSPWTLQGGSGAGHGGRRRFGGAPLLRFADGAGATLHALNVTADARSLWCLDSATRPSRSAGGVGGGRSTPFATADDDDDGAARTGARSECRETATRVRIAALSQQACVLYGAPR